MADEARLWRLLSRRGLIVGVAVLGGVLGLIVLARVLLASPWGLAQIERRLDGASLGPLGRIEAHGLTGDLLSELALTSLSVSDAEGDWLRLEGVSARWRPSDMFARRLVIESLGVERVKLLRRPTIGDPTPPSADRRGGAWAIELGALALGRIELAEGVAGPAAVAGASGALSWSTAGTGFARFDARRLDDGADRIRLDARRDEDGAIDLELNIDAPAGGVLAAALRAPGQALALTATGSGDAVSAAGIVTASIDGETAGRVDLAWRDDALNVTAEAALDRAPWTANLADIVGAAARVEATLSARQAGGARVVALAAETPQLSVDVDARLDLAARRLANDARIVARARDLAVPEGVGRALGLASASLGSGVFDGLVGFEPSPRVSGTLNLEDLAIDGRRVQRANASINGVVDPDGRWGGRLAGAVEGLSAGEAIAALFGEAVQGAFEFAADPSAGRLRLSSARLNGANAELSLQGEWGLADGPSELTGRADIAAISSFIEGAAGGLTLDGRLTREAGKPVRFETTAQARDLVLSEPVGALLGLAPRASAIGRLEAGSLVVERFDAKGARLVVEGEGAVSTVALTQTSSPAALSARLDFALEGPFALDPAAFDGALGGAATLGGTVLAPELRVQANATAVEIAGERFDSVVARLESAGALSAARGRVEIEAQSARGPARAGADLAIDGRTLVVEDLAGRWAGGVVSGGARVVDGVALGGFALDHAPSAGRARLTLDQRTGGQGVAFDAQLGPTPLGARGQLDALRLTANGALDDLALTASAAGTTGAAFDVALDAELITDAKGINLSLTPRGTLAGERLSAVEPARLTMGSSGLDLTLDLGLGAGRVTLAAARSAEGARVALEARSVPLTLLALLNPEVVLAGTADGRADLAGARTLDGPVRVTLSDARPVDRPELSGLEATFDATLSRAGAAFTLEAASEGLTAEAGGSAPFTIAAASLQPRFDTRARMAVDVRANGDVASLAALAAPPGLEAQGALAFEAKGAGVWSDPVWTGSARLSDAALYDRRSGLALEAMTGRARFDGPALILDDFSATDGGEGRLTASGRLALDGDGPRATIDVALRSLRTGVGPRSEAVVDGAVSVEFGPEQRALRADIIVERADLTPPESGAAGVPSLEVIEINRPAALDPPPPPKGEPFALDVAARADRRVFVRAPGLTTEWGFDVRVGGDTEATLIDGTATLIKGEMEIGGERFVFDEAIVRLNGAPETAELALTARREADDLIAIVEVSGRAARPSIRLSSRPAYPEDEILSRVLFGRSAAELSALEAAQLAAALAQLAGGGGLDLAGSLRAGLGVDRLSVSRGAAGSGPIVSGGKYIAENVYLEVASGSTSGAPEARLEWEIRPRLELVSRFGAARDAAIALRWRRDY